MNNTPWTHFVTTAPNTNHAFSIEKCEKCGGECEAPNAVTLMGPASKLKRLGMVEMTGTLQELWCNEKTGMAVCDSCDYALKAKA